jgi:hypothetical protein
MSTPEFFIHVWAWLMSDWTHPIVAAAAATALTPTPAPGTWAGKAYRLLDTLALNVLHAKSTGVSPAALAEQIATALVQKKQAEAAVAPQNPQ